MKHLCNRALISSALFVFLAATSICVAQSGSDPYGGSNTSSTTVPVTTSSGTSTAPSVPSGSILIPHTVGEWLSALLQAVENWQMWLVGVLLVLVVGFGLLRLFASSMYKPGQPESAYGASRWAAFCATCSCFLLSLLVPFILKSWFWLDYWVLGTFLFFVSFVFLIAAVSYKPRRTA